jgi:hypothetical protein
MTTVKKKTTSAEVAARIADLRKIGSDLAKSAVTDPAKKDLEKANALTIKIYESMHEVLVKLEHVEKGIEREGHWAKQESDRITLEAIRLLGTAYRLQH